MKKMVLIEYQHVPHFVQFRLKKRWWRRLVGSELKAITVDDKKNGLAMNLYDDEVVGVEEKRLPNHMRYHIIEEK